MDTLLLGPAPGATAMLRSAADLLDAIRQSREQPALRWDASGLDRVLRFDETGGLAEVQNSTPWRSLAASLGTRFPHLHELASAPCELPPTVGMAVAQNAPGPDGRPFVVHVESIALVTPDGELRRVSRMEHPELFALVVGGQGVIGAPYSVTLRVTSLAGSISRRSDSPPTVTPTETDITGPVARLLVPVESAAALAAAVRACLEEWNLSPSRLDAIAISPDGETYLRWCTRESLMFRVGLPRATTVAASVRLEQVQRALIACALELGGSFPIATTRAASREQTERAYPMLRGFFAEKRRHDPRECLQSAWYRHYRNLIARRACDVSWQTGPTQTP